MVDRRLICATGGPTGCLSGPVPCSAKNAAAAPPISTTADAAPAIHNHVGTPPALAFPCGFFRFSRVPEVPEGAAPESSKANVLSAAGATTGATPATTGAIGAAAVVFGTAAVRPRRAVAFPSDVSSSRSGVDSSFDPTALSM